MLVPVPIRVSDGANGSSDSGCADGCPISSFGAVMNNYRACESGGVAGRPAGPTHTQCSESIGLWQRMKKGNVRSFARCPRHIPCTCCCGSPSHANPHRRKNRQVKVEKVTPVRFPAPVFRNSGVLSSGQLNREKCSISCAMELRHNLPVLTPENRTKCRTAASLRCEIVIAMLWAGPPGSPPRLL